MRRHVTARKRRDRRERESSLGVGGIECGGHAPRPKLPPLEEPTRARDGGTCARRNDDERRECFDGDRGERDLHDAERHGLPVASGPVPLHFRQHVVTRPLEFGGHSGRPDDRRKQLTLRTHFLARTALRSSANLLDGEEGFLTGRRRVSPPRTALYHPSRRASPLRAALYHPSRRISPLEPPSTTRVAAPPPLEPPSTTQVVASPPLEPPSSTRVVASPAKELPSTTRAVAPPFRDTLDDARVPLKPGDRIERYIIDGLLGSGGMGDVYRAHDTRLKRSVAFKILQAEDAPDAQGPTAARSSPPTSSGAARMMREAQLAAALDHPNVVAVFDVGQIEHPPELRGTTYLAMELIRGETLRKYIGDPRVRMRVRVRWLEEMARALAAAHAAGLVHRDVKPENVMIRDDGIVKVLDFGIAKRTLAAPTDPMSSTEGYAVSTLSAQGAVVGTPVYMAPEQIRGDAVDGRADQFAWGVVAYELLAGTRLWSLEGGAYSLVAQILQTPAPSLATVPRVEPRVAAVVARALEKDPAARFPTMDALIDALVGSAGEGDSEARVQVSSPSLPDSGEAGLAEAPTQASGKLAGIVASVATETTGPTRPIDPPRARPRTWGARAAVVLTALAALLVAAGGALRWRARSHDERFSTAAAATPAPECTTNHDCPFGDPKAPRICRAGTCRDLASADCHVLAVQEEIADDATLWIGTMFPTSEEGDGEEIKANERAAELARSDFWDVTHGLPSATGMGASRPIGIVACDDAKHPKEVAHHLVDDVGVPAVIGFSVPDEVADLSTTLFLPHGVLVFDAMCPDEFIASMPQPPGGPRLLWRTMASGRFGQLLAAALVESVVEPQLRAAPSIGKSGRIRVAEVRVGARSDTIFDNMHFNGKTVAENRDDFLYVAVWAKDWFKGDFSATIAALEKFQPDVVIFDDTKLFEAILDPVESHHRSGALPRWIGIGSLMTEPIKHALSRRPGLTARIYEQDVVRNANRERLRNSIRNHFPDAPDDEYGEATYDAVYAIAYAAYAASPGRAPLTGATIASGIARLLPPGVPTDVGRAAKYQAFETLRSGASIDLRGAATELDFDPKTGDSRVDLDVLCVAPKGDSVTELPSGLRFNGRTSRLEGKLECR